MQPPPLLQGPEADFAIWAAKSIGSAGLNFLAGKLFQLMDGNPDEPDLLQKLEDISTAIEDIKKTQVKMVEQQKKAADDIKLALLDINTTVQQQALDKVDSDLDTWLRNPTRTDSLEWFIQNQTNSVDELKSADGVKYRTDFAYRVIRQYGVLNDFNVVARRMGGLKSIEGSNILDNFINKIVISDAKSSTLEDRYRAMETYFTMMIGLQVECATLITNAYEQLASSPQYGKEFTGSADEFTNDIYRPALRAEAVYFQNLVRKLVARELVLPTNSNEPPVAVSRVIQDVILPRADFLTMNLLGEAPGLRARVLVSPNTNPRLDYYGYYKIVDAYGGPPLVSLPTANTSCAKDLDQNCCTRMVGPTLYDSWLTPGAGFAEFFVTKDWLLLQTTVPVQPGRSTFLMVRDVDDVTGWSKSYGFQRISLRKMGLDRNGNLVPSDNGVLFGSVVLARRASAESMLHIPGRVKDCKSPVIASYGVDSVSIANCWSSNKQANVQSQAAFRYCSTCSTPVTGGFTFGVTLRLNGDLGSSSAYTSLLCAYFRGPISIITRTPDKHIFFQDFPITWQPGGYCWLSLVAQVLPYNGARPLSLGAVASPVFMNFR